MKTYEIINLFESAVAQNVNIVDIIRDHLNNSGTIASIRNSFVHFTDREKLGIRPNTRWDFTPKGIYSYPSEFVLGECTNDELDGSICFSDLPTVYLFSMRGNIVNLDEMPQAELNEYKNILFSKYDKLIPHWKKDTILTNSKNDAKGIPGKEFYLLVKNITESILGDNEEKAIKWNNIFRSIGIDGLVNSGVRPGIITSDLHAQSIAFSYKSVYDISSHRNVTVYFDQALRTKSKTEKNRELFASIEERQKFCNELMSKPESEIKHVVANSDLRIWRNLDVPEFIQRCILERLWFPTFFKYVKNPCTMIRKVAAKTGMWIKYIKNPTEYEQILSIRNNVKNVNNISNLTKGAMRYAIAVREDNHTLVDKLDNIYDAWPKFNIEDLLEIPSEYRSASMNAAIRDWKKKSINRI